MVAHIKKSEVEVVMMFSFQFLEATTFNCVAYLIKMGLKAATILKNIVALRKAQMKKRYHPQHLKPEMQEVVRRGRVNLQQG